MERILNAKKKLICCIDREKKVVQIQHKRHITTIKFLSNGQVVIRNESPKK